MSATHVVGGRRLFFSLWSKKIRMRNRMHKSKHHSGEPGRDGQVRNCYQTFRLTELEATELAQHAESTGRSVSQMVRIRVLGKPPPLAAAPAANREMYAGLAPTTSNLNQIAHAFNESIARGEPGLTNMIEVDSVKKLVLELGVQVAELRADLIGASQK